MDKKWGFLRETRKAAEKAGIDSDTGYFRTGLEDYLAVIFPDVAAEDWIHDSAFGRHGGQVYRIRPDYRCDKLKLIVEFDGLPHYQDPDIIRRDTANQRVYEEHGYKVVRIPYFIQLTNAVVKKLFDVEMRETLFPPDIPSMGIKGRNTPAYCCPAGLFRMAEELKKYPQQKEINIKALRAANDDYLTGLSMLEQIIETGSLIR